MTGGRDRDAGFPDPPADPHRTTPRAGTAPPAGTTPPAGAVPPNDTVDPDAPPAFRAALAADPAQLSPTREALRAWLTTLGAGEADVEVALIAVGEACANAIEHGYRFAAGSTVLVRGRLRGDRLEIEVSDTGGWRGPRPDGGDRGRGELIMTRLMDEARIDGTPEGTTVRLVKHLADLG
ncbi:ATP-binding protein [Micromonospora rifamycinica]|uniref:Anti-sigma regulatory factor (Ser/Thr protein kinase) n=1 Tax=Micromonospora rifamycinica TaxID=291594 RepID=A0A1C5HDQ8_9ACTN|nr:ATP-binding protein [Micromonospora rifamycinica]SCG44145.1 Anti-sigma regulatory factor (Ser/Thr protein kinase) [Micromonospora rifamycinica]